MIRELYRGVSGDDVKNMQAMLNLHLALKTSPPLKPDGIFGPKTDGRVRYFQQINRLAADGIVGPKTRRAILDFRRIQGPVAGAPTVNNMALRRRNGAFRRPAALLTNAAASKPTAIATTRSLKFTTPRSLPVLTQFVQQQAPPANPPKTVSVVVQQGTQVSAKPWVFSPMVLTSQVNFFIRNDGRKPFVISPGLQFAANQVGSPVGPWTGQAFVQFGPAEITDGPIDWFNPFVQLALQKNANQPFSLGLAIGDQVNWNLINDRLSLFVNGQAVTAVDLSTGLCSAPALQILGGASFIFILF